MPFCRLHPHFGVSIVIAIYPLIIFCGLSVAIYFMSIFGSPLFFNEASKEESDRQTDQASNQTEQAVHVNFGSVVNMIKLSENGFVRFAIACFRCRRVIRVRKKWRQYIISISGEISIFCRAQNVDSGSATRDCKI